MNHVDDLASLDAALHAGLMSLKRHFAAGGSNDELGLFFEINEEGGGSIPLVPDGASLAVTAENVGRYIALAAHYRLNVAIAPQVAAFLSGFRQLVPLPWMRMFGPSELQVCRHDS